MLREGGTGGEEEVEESYALGQHGWVILPVVICLRSLETEAPSLMLLDLTPYEMLRSCGRL